MSKNEVFDWQWVKEEEFLPCFFIGQLWKLESTVHYTYHSYVHLVHIYIYIYILSSSQRLFFEGLGWNRLRLFCHNAIKIVLMDLFTHYIVHVCILSSVYINSWEMVCDQGHSTRQYFFLKTRSSLHAYCTL